MKSKKLEINIKDIKQSLNNKNNSISGKDKNATIKTKIE